MSGDIETTRLLHGDCLDVLPTLAASSVDLVLTDPPYYKVKKDAWDRQWKTPEDYLIWLRRVLVEFRRVLKPNGSLYLFASPQMSARVECCVGEVFDVLNRITWRKSEGRHKASHKEGLRAYFPASESILFAEQKGSDSIAKGEAQYVAKCDELRGFVFEPIRAYLDSERLAAGLSVRQVAEKFQQKTGSRTVTGMAGHWFTSVQWALPTHENYIWLQSLAEGRFRRQYEDLRRQYEDLRRQYEDLRRPFTVTANVPYTDVWDFPTVPHYRGKHPCEKPAALIEHMITASSRPGAVVLDAFMGSGVVGEVALKLNRNFIGIEADAAWHSEASARVGKAKP
jgi:site-specific DNA-methyltransferase (adenine-specific)